MRRLLLLAVVATVALLWIAAAGFWWLRGRGRPRRSGDVSLSALEAEARVRWDAWGVPHVRAQSGRDLSAALGYLHANDRLAQMELGRRAAGGRLSELFGRRTLEIDEKLRRLRLRTAAERMWSGAGLESREWLEAYAGGVNAWLEERRGDLPPSLTLLGIEPEPWTPLDSLGFVCLMFRDLSFWQGRPEEIRFRWLAQLGNERLRDLLGEPELYIPEAIVELAAVLGSAGPAGAEPGAGVGTGSNNWALGASRTSSSRPLVASDPHLPLRLPGTWFQVHLRSPDYEAAGMSLPGLPGVVIGQTAHLAWALTNMMLDDHDLFFEQLDPQGRRVRRGEQWRQIQMERQVINLRAGGGVEIELRSTDLGPLLEAEPERGLPARSLLWSGHLPADPLAALVRLARARELAEIPEAVSSYVGPAQNLVVAHRDGGLLYTVLGRLPARRRGDGRLPSPGWDPSYGWDGLSPAADNPLVVDPEADLLATANHDIRPPAYRGRLSADFDTPFRYLRIVERLAARRRWTTAETAELQVDVVSEYAREVVAALAGQYRGAAERAYRALVAWDGEMSQRGPAALFALLERELVEAVFGDEVLLEGASGQTQRWWICRLLRGEMSSRWFDDVRTPEVEPPGDVVAACLAAAWRRGAARWGQAVEAWSYGDLHPMTLAHPLGSLPLLGRWLDRGPYGMSGSATTVAAFGGSWRNGRQPVTYGPSMRWIAVPGAGDEALAVLPGGQSGHPADPHYDDQLELYLEGRMHSAPWSEQAIEAATVSRLALRPRGATSGP